MTIPVIPGPVTFFLSLTNMFTLNVNPPLLLFIHYLLLKSPRIHNTFLVSLTKLSLFDQPTGRDIFILPRSSGQVPPL